MWNAGGVAYLNGGGPGTDDLPPLKAFGQQAGFQAGVNAALASLGALFARLSSGAGQHIEISAQECLLSILELTFEFFPYMGLTTSRLGQKPIQPLDYSMNGMQPERVGNRDPYMAPHGVFRCAGQDRWVSLAVRDDAEWQHLCAAMSRPDLTSDPRFATLAARKQNEDELEAIITQWTLTRSPEEATEQLQVAGIPAALSMSNKDLATDPHLNSRSIFVHLEHPEVGVKQHVGIPWQFSKTPLTVRKAAPTLGQDTEHVLREILGYSAEAVAALKDRQVLT